VGPSELVSLLSNVVAISTACRRAYTGLVAPLFLQIAHFTARAYLGIFQIGQIGSFPR
jgi:hypothetical protein